MEELLLRLLNGIKINNEAYFSYKLLDTIGFKKDYVKTYLDKLKNNKDIEDLRINGFYQRFKINTVLDCYKFIVNPLYNTKRKEYLLILVKNKTDILNLEEKNYTFSAISKITGLSVNIISKLNKYLNELGTTIKNILLNECDIIDNFKFDTNYGFVLDEDNNMQNSNGSSKGDIVYKNKEKNCRCYICGEDNSENFTTSNIICKKCQKDNLKEKYKNTMAEYLYKLVKKSYSKLVKENINNNRIEFDLTVNFISELLEKQNYKCFYTKHDLLLGDEIYSPSIDRINSDKGYTKNNICICGVGINKIKFNLSINKFKEIIKELYQNINNF